MYNLPKLQTHAGLSFRLHLIERAKGQNCVTREKVWQRYRWFYFFFRSDYCATTNWYAPHRWAVWTQWPHRCALTTPVDLQYFDKLSSLSNVLAENTTATKTTHVINSTNIYFLVNAYWTRHSILPRVGLLSDFLYLATEHLKSLSIQIVISVLITDTCPFI